MAVPVAVSCVAELKVVCKGALANKTSAPLTSPLPLTVSVKLPTETVVGETEVNAGIGLSSVTGAAADTEGFAVLVAVTFTVLGFGRFAGAV
jgi:hypothetical protein